MLSGTEWSGCKKKAILPILNSCDLQGSNDKVIEEGNLPCSRWIS